MTNPFEAIIIGGGPAGLSAALFSGRARREVLLVDGGTPRNAAAPAIHSFVTRDGILPKDFRAAARNELAQYKTVAFAHSLVNDISGEVGKFEVRFENGDLARATRIILATGLVDTLPAIPGVRERWGNGVHQCPYCDGWEHRDGEWGLLIEQPEFLEHAPFFTAWSTAPIVFTNGSSVPEESARMLARGGIRVVSEPIKRVIGGAGHSMKAVELADGRHIPIESFWVRAAQRQTDLVARLGLTLGDDGAVKRDESGQTSTPGIYAAGDLSAGPAQQAILAAADGARVMLGVIRQLVLESYAERTL